MAGPGIRIIGIPQEPPEGVEAAAVGWRARLSWIRMPASLLPRFPIPSEPGRDPRRGWRP